MKKRYSQTEKESLAIAWLIEKFYYYLAVTYQNINPTAKHPAGIERWLLRLQSFKFRVIYHNINPTAKHPARIFRLQTFKFISLVKKV